MSTPTVQTMDVGCWGCLSYGTCGLSFTLISGLSGVNVAK